MTPCLLDAHVHLYDVLDPARLIAAADRHRRGHARALGLPEATPALLLLAQTAAERPPAEVLAGLLGWEPRPAAGGALRLSRDGDGGTGAEIVVVPGGQTVTAEGLEVLALGTPVRIPDGLPADETLRHAAAAGALVVLPWGVAKWTGARGALVARLLEDPGAPPNLALGDNAGRPSFWPRPPLFAAAEAAGRVVLPGTDPLPVASEADKVLRLGARVEADPADPAGSLRAWIASGGRPEPVGRLERPGRFVALQAAMQLRKRRGRH